MAIKDPVIINEDIGKVLEAQGYAYKTILPQKFVNFGQKAAIERSKMDKGVIVGLANMGTAVTPKLTRPCMTVLRTAKVCYTKSSDGTIANKGKFYNGALSSINPSNMLTTWGQSNVTALAASANYTSIRDASCDIHAIGLSVRGTWREKISTDPVPDGSLVVEISNTFKLYVDQQANTYTIKLKFNYCYLEVPIAIEYIALALNYNATSQSPEDCVVRSTTTPSYNIIDDDICITSSYSGCPFTTWSPSEGFSYQAVDGSGCYLKLSGTTLGFYGLFAIQADWGGSSFTFTSKPKNPTDSEVEVYGGPGAVPPEILNNSYVYIPYNFGAAYVGVTQLTGKKCYIRAKINFA